MYLDLTFRQEQSSQPGEFSFGETAYLRTEDGRSFGPSKFAWSERQLRDLSTLFLGQEADGARQRIGRDIGALLASLAWNPQKERLEANDLSGEESVLVVRSSAPELYTLPWEIAPTDASDFYLADHPSVLIRYVLPGLPARDRCDAPPHPGILFGWSDAGGRVPNAAAKEILESAAEAGGVDFLEVPRIHAGSLQDALDEKPLSVVHLLCHGLPGKNGAPPSLAWGDGQQKPVSAPQLAKLLRPYRDSIRMVVLSACGSGDASQDALFLGSIAQEMHKNGIPTVVASRFLLSIPGALRLTRELYQKLLHEGWSLERSARYARMRLFRADERGETSTGDAYGLQLYTHAIETATEAQGARGGARPVLSTYPFGTSSAPTPRVRPPRQTITLVPTSLPGDTRTAALVAALRELGEDPGLAIEEQGSGDAAGVEGANEEAAPLVISLSVDASQRLFEAKRDGRLEKRLGFAVAGLIVATPFAAYALVSGAAAAVAAASGAAGGAAAGGGATAAGAAGGVAAKAGLALGAKVAIGAVLVAGATAGGAVLLSETSPMSASSSAAVSSSDAVCLKAWPRLRECDGTWRITGWKEGSVPACTPPALCFSRCINSATCAEIGDKTPPAEGASALATCLNACQPPLDGSRVNWLPDPEPATSASAEPSDAGPAPPTSASSGSPPGTPPPSLGGQH